MAGRSGHPKLWVPGAHHGPPAAPGSLGRAAMCVLRRPLPCLRTTVLSNMLPSDASREGTCQHAARGPGCGDAVRTLRPAGGHGLQAATGQPSRRGLSPPAQAAQGRAPNVTRTSREVSASRKHVACTAPTRPPWDSPS